MQKNTDNWYAIVNPAAGKGEVKKHLGEIIVRLEKAFPGIHIVMTDYRGHASEITVAAIEKGYRKLLAIGGDGTHNEVVNGIFNQTSVPTIEITYALLPYGTGNDWIRTHHIPKDLIKWLAMIKKGITYFQDVGKVSYYKDGVQHKRYFANVAGLAYDAFVVRVAENKRTPIKNNLAYLFLIFKCLFQYSLKKAKVSFDGQEKEGYFYTINAGICKYSGGGMQVVPHAIPDDGYLAFTLAGKISKLGVLLNTWRFYNGSIGKHPKVITKQVKKIEVKASGKEEVLLEVDGEFLGHTPVEIELIPKALKFVAP